MRGVQPSDYFSLACWHNHLRTQHGMMKSISACAEIKFNTVNVMYLRSVARWDISVHDKVLVHHLS